MVSDIDALVARACDGDQRALGEVLESLRPMLHRLAVAMLWDRQDADDATQEILIAVMTNLAGWRGEASLSTWAYRIGVRLLSRRRRSRTERAEVTFDSFAADLRNGLVASDRADADLLAAEVRVGCTLAMLQCLDRDHRVCYVLGEILGLPGHEAAAAAGLGHDAYRKRLSRARARIRDFVAEHCGLVNPASACRCDRRVEAAIRIGRIDPHQPRFTIETTARDLQQLQDAAALMRALPELAGSDDLVARAIAVVT